MKTIAWKDYLFFAGVAVGFLLAVALGREAAGRSKPEKFERFYWALSPESFYYPTFASMERLALERWSPGKILVIVGGNSVLHGAGLPVADLWSKRLQELIGPGYAVINLSLNGAFATEGAPLVAEALQRRGIPVILIANTAPNVCGLPVGSTYEYFYWEALAAGKLTPYAPRDVAIAASVPLRKPMARENSAELQRAARLNHWLHFQDLWGHVAYRYFFTAWTPVARHAPWAARIKAGDQEPPVLPVERRFSRNNAREMEIARATTETLMVRDQAGHWQKDLPAWELLDKQIEATFVPALRPCTLMILSMDCPYYRNQLTSDELARDEAAYRAGAAVWPKHGIRSVLAGPGFSSEDYVDLRHPSPSGSTKLANLVAAEILKMQPSLP